MVTALQLLTVLVTGLERRAIRERIGRITDAGEAVKTLALDVTEREQRQTGERVQVYGKPGRQYGILQRWDGRAGCWRHERSVDPDYPDEIPYNSRV